MFSPGTLEVVDVSWETIMLVFQFVQCSLESEMLPSIFE